MGQGGSGAERRPRRRNPAGGRSFPPPRHRSRAGAKEACIAMSVLLVEDRGAVRFLTMNRPEKRNALNSALTQGLLDALHAADADEGVGAVVLTGAGQAFCAGADLAEFKDLKDPRADEGRRVIRELAAKADVFLENFPVGTLGRYGLDFAALGALNPRLIYVSC